MHASIDSPHGAYQISDDPVRLDTKAIHAYLHRAYWSKDVPFEVVERSVQASLCIGAYDSTGAQVGPARFISDYATFCYVTDVYVLEEHRGLGLSKAMMNMAMGHRKLKRLRRWTLNTLDAHGLYARFAFECPARPERCMERLAPNISTDNSPAFSEPSARGRTEHSRQHLRGPPADPNIPPRVEPLTPPFAPDVQAVFDKIMPPAVPSLALFTTLARVPRIYERLCAGSLLDRGPVSLRYREIVIDRTCARCGCAYEWGVHIALFADRAALEPEQVRATVRGNALDPVWSAEEMLLIRLVDELHDAANISDQLWKDIVTVFSIEQIFELIAQPASTTRSRSSRTV